MENNNIFTTPGGGTVIMNGGNPLPGCPNDWDEAWKIEEAYNEDKQGDEGYGYNFPKWKFDCGFKLDFDGSLLTVSSRFYPPKTHYGPTWDGNVTIYLMDKEVAKKEFDCPTLDQLKSEAEAFVKEFTDKLENLFTR